MATVLEQIPLGSSVAVIRLRSLGDCVLTTPALQLLKTFRPDLQIGVVVEDRFAAVFAGNPDVASTLAPRRGEVTGWKPVLTLNLHGGTRSMALTATSRAPVTAGFAHHSGAWMYKVRIPRAQEIFGVERPVHTAEHLASAMFYLGVPLGEIPRARLFAAQGPDRAAYAVLHPFASAPDKTWPVERFLEAAHFLRRSLDLDVVFIGAETDDFRPFAAYECIAGSSLEEVKALLYGASFFLGNDSGPAHLAAALRVPLVVLFGASDPIAWAPWKAHAEQIVAPDGDLRSVTVREVLTALERLKVRA